MLSRALLAILGCLAQLADAQAPGGAVAAEADVRVAYEAGELAHALELARALPDPALSAEWRFHVLYHGGDLTGALLAAESGLAGAPEHPRLLENAARCALALGLGGRAAAHVARWRGLTDLDGPELLRARELGAKADVLVERERAARSAEARARAVAFSLAVAFALALAAARLVTARH
jgi:hypothetical protein